MVTPARTYVPKSLLRASLTCASCAVVWGLFVPNADAVDLPSSLPVKAPADARIYDWTGFYVGGHVGLALGNSNWTANATTPGAPAVSGSLDMYRPPDAFYESGSWLLGVQGGYDYIVIDSPAPLDERILEAVELADQIILVTGASRGIGAEEPGDEGDRQ